jgi:hypothetical protein
LFDEADQEAYPYKWEGHWVGEEYIDFGACAYIGPCLTPAEVAAEVRAAAEALEDAWTTIRALAPPAQASAGDGWLPIKSAPRDGTRIWAWFPLGPATGTQQAYAVRWTNDRVGGWALDDGESAALTYDAPTHFRPLPAPPALSQEGQADG